jgi:hypothetical protein
MMRPRVFMMIAVRGLDAALEVAASHPDTEVASSAQELWQATSSPLASPVRQVGALATKPPTRSGWAVAERLLHFVVAGGLWETGHPWWSIAVCAWVRMICGLAAGVGARLNERRHAAKPITSAARLNGGTALRPLPPVGSRRSPGPARVATNWMASRLAYHHHGLAVTAARTGQFRRP